MNTNKEKLSLSGQKIHHKNRIRSPDELKVGEVYIYHSGRDTSKIMITKIHFPKDGWFRAIYAEGPRIGKQDEFSMADCGLIPYKPNGGWNYFNYLVLADWEED